MPRVYVKDYDTYVNFPENIPQEEMQTALQKQFPSKAQQQSHSTMEELKNIPQNTLLGVGNIVKSATDYLHTTPETKRKVMEYVEPILEFGGMAAGEIAGLPFGGPVGAIAGGGLGGATGKVISKSIKQQIALEEPKTISESFKEAGHDIVQDMAYSMGGQIIGATVAGGIKGLAILRDKFHELFPSLSSKTIDERIGDILKQHWSNLPEAKTNIKKAKGVEKELGEQQFTIGQRTDDPGLIKLQRSLERQPGQAAAAKQTQLESINQEVQKMFENRFPEKGELRDVLARYNKTKEELEKSIISAKEGMIGKVGKLEERPDIQESGKRIYNIISKAKEGEKALLDERYSNLGDELLSLDKIRNTQAKMIIDFRKSGDAKSDLPSNILSQIKESIENSHGKGINFQQAKGIITSIYENIADAMVFPKNRKLARRLELLKTSLEETMDTAKTIDINKYKILKKDFRNFADKYYKGNVADILSKGKRGELTKIKPEDIGKQFMTPTGADQFISTVGKNPEAIQAMKDYIGQDLLKKAINPVTKEITEKGLKSYLNKNRLILDKFGFTKDFRSLSEAQDLINNSLAKYDEFNASVAAKMLGVDPKIAIKEAFSGKSGKNPSIVARQLMGQTKGDEAAMQGLKKAFGEYFLDKIRFISKDLMGEETIQTPRLMQINKFIDEMKPAIRELYIAEPLKRRALDTIQKTYQILNRTSKSPLGGGSDTAELLNTIHDTIAGKILVKIPIVGKNIMLISKWLSGQEKELLNEHLVRALYDPDFAETLIMAAKGIKPEIVEKRFVSQFKILGGKAGLTGMAFFKYTGQVIDSVNETLSEQKE